MTFIFSDVKVLAMQREVYFEGLADGHEVVPIIREPYFCLGPDLDKYFSGPHSNEPPVGETAYYKTLDRDFEPVDDRTKDKDHPLHSCRYCIVDPKGYLCNLDGYKGERSCPWADVTSKKVFEERMAAVRLLKPRP